MSLVEAESMCNGRSLHATLASGGGRPSTWSPSVRIRWAAPQWPIAAYPWLCEAPAESLRRCLFLHNNCDPFTFSDHSVEENIILNPHQQHHDQLAINMNLVLKHASFLQYGTALPEGEFGITYSACQQKVTK